MKLIITGATGFIGSRLATYFLDRNYEVFIIVRPNSDLSNLDLKKSNLKICIYDNSLKSLTSLFSKVRPVCTFHLASLFIPEHQTSDIDRLVQSNIHFGLHLLEAMKEAQVKTLVNTGTSWQHFNNEIYNPVCLYAATKQAFENLIEYYVQAESFNVITLKIFDTYGETDTRPKLISMLKRASTERIQLKLSPGDQMMNLVHIEDVCAAYEKAMKLLENNKKATHSKYLIKHPQSYTLREVVGLFEVIHNVKLEIEWGGRPYRKREVMQLFDKGMVLPDWQAKIPLPEGLKRFKIY